MIPQIHAVFERPSTEDHRSLLRAPGSRSALLLATVLCLVTFAYAKIYDAPFIWDDRKLIVANPGVSSPGNVLESFYKPFWPTAIDGSHERGYYRPLVTLSFVADHGVFGPTPAGFHLTNILLHLLNVSLLFQLVRRWQGGLLSAALASALWGLQPRLSESVTWISGRTDVLAASFCLIALLVWSSVSTPRRWSAAAFLLAGLLSKEVSIAIIPAIIILEWGRLRGEPCVLRLVLRRTLPLLSVSAIYLVARALALPAVVGQDQYHIGRQRPLLVLSTLATYAEMLMDPLRPRTQIGLVRFISVPAVAAGAIIAVALVFLAIVAARKARPETLAALGLAIGGFLPVIHLLPLANNVVAADRFLYLPTAGIALAAALASIRLTRFVSFAFASILVASLPVLAWNTRLRNEVWRNEIRFWVDAVKTSPLQNKLPRLQLAEVLFRSGRSEEMLRVVSTVPLLTWEFRSFPSRRPQSLQDETAPSLEMLGRFELAFWAVARSITIADPDATRILEATVAMQELRFGDARRLLSIGGKEPADRIGAYLLKIAMEKEAALKSLEAASRWGSNGDRLAKRALVLTSLGGDLARKNWTDVVRSPGAPIGAIRFGAEYLVSRGSDSTLRRIWPDLARRLPLDELALLQEMAAQRREENELIRPLILGLEEEMARALPAAGASDGTRNPS